MSSQQVEILVSQAQQLPFDEQLLLIKRLAENLVEAKPTLTVKRGLIRGKYKNTGLRQSTEEDFKLAEWHPTEKDLDGP